MRHFTDALFEEIEAEFIPTAKELQEIADRIKAEVDAHEKDGPYGNQNCMLCTWAVELQLRGEDFLPRPVISEDDIIFEEGHYNFVKSGKKETFESVEDLQDILVADARYYCHVNWADSEGGHEFLLVNTDGNIYIVDGQAGKVVELSKDNEYFNDINFSNSYVVRVDDKELNQEVLNLNNVDKMSKSALEESLENIVYKDISDLDHYKKSAKEILGSAGGQSDNGIMDTGKEIYIDDKLVGYISFEDYDDVEGYNKVLGFGNFMILERGKGYGTQVIQNLVTDLKDEYDLIYCFVDAENSGAINLYKKLGKVYDEDGPNDNGQYYVTFWDKNENED
jgi:RimJ/RimL family protein N-acetyltransferase